MAFLRLLEPESFVEDAGVPAVDDAALFGVDAEAGDGAGFAVISSSFFSGDPDGDLLAAIAVAFVEEDGAFEYRLCFKVDAGVDRAL